MSEYILLIKDNDGNTAASPELESTHAAAAIEEATIYLNEYPDDTYKTGEIFMRVHTIKNPKGEPKWREFY